jgi:predicted TIM-barrel fold metal-dependent hydrolase
MAKPTKSSSKEMAPARIVDAHHHVWRRSDLAWLSGPMQPRIFGPYQPIRRDYPIEEYLADARPAGVVKSVYVQTNWPPAGETDEAAWIQSVSDRNGFPQAFVGYADLASPALVATLDALMKHRGLRGIRQQLHWHENAAYRFASRPDLMNDASWRRGLGEVAKRKLLFELQIFASQMTDGARLARDFSDLEFVLLHAGMLEDTSAAGWSIWRAGMKLLSACPNVSVKLSGLGTFSHRCDAALWRPVIEETLALFGPQRCLFGSNFPIEKLWTDYRSIVSAVNGAISGLNDAERDAVFCANAMRLYRL